MLNRGYQALGLLLVLFIGQGALAAGRPPMREHHIGVPGSYCAAEMPTTDATDFESNRPRCVQVEFSVYTAPFDPRSPLAALGFSRTGDMGQGAHIVDLGLASVDTTIGRFDFTSAVTLPANEILGLIFRGDYGVPTRTGYWSLKISTEGVILYQVSHERIRSDYNPSWVAGRLRPQ